MGEVSKISWTDATFNPWHGCVKVSPACDHCYAEAFSKRIGKEIWGVDAPRRFFGDKHWNEPLKWDRDALKTFGRPMRVFCASMADVFEDRPELILHRGRLWTLIDKTPNLCWNLLTKRHLALKEYDWQSHPNAHPGVTVENQTYDFRITREVEWISAEPLFGYMNLRRFLKDTKLKWVIIGGESGPGAREMPMEAAQDLIEQCKQYDVAVHFKQTGDVLARQLGLKDRSGKDPAEWPKELQVQEFPEYRAVSQ